MLAGLEEFGLLEWGVAVVIPILVFSGAIAMQLERPC